MSFRSEHPLVSRENSRGGVGVDLKIVPGCRRGRSEVFGGRGAGLGTQEVPKSRLMGRRVVSP